VPSTPQRDRVLTPELLDAAAKAGLTVLEPQPTPDSWASLDVLVHKCRAPRDAALLAALQSFAAGHPTTRLLDPLEAVAAVDDRERMLAVLASGPLLLMAPPAQDDSSGSSSGSRSWPARVRVAAPPQAVLRPGDDVAAATAALAVAGVRLPALAKPLSAAAGHALGAVLSEQGLSHLLAGREPALAPPVLLQSFVPHGDALYKVRVLAL
jgi:Inositol 1,3,4-trisphosphate 5/6-kinase ATP-grasp domain/Inositol 1,3,4-trisphosphate 5/6-kinase pre-ATP-grasp domain